MPLVRFELKNEYGLADPMLYRKPSRTEDPKPALDGLAVAGLVGILRQLGDLVEFGADVFRDLHEQVMITGARGQKISSRIQLTESALPSLEKAAQDQKSHIHFTYIAGCDWRATVQTEQNQLICSELPQYMLDSYEECHNPPQLHLLDKFDTAGSGACLRRYSDPSYFRRVVASSEAAKHKKMKRRRQKKGSGLRSREIREIIRPSETSGTQFASPGTGHLNFSVDSISMTDTIPKSEVERDSTFSDLETRVNFQVLDPPSIMDGEQGYNESPASTSSINPNDPLVSMLHNEPAEDTPDGISQRDSLKQHSVLSSCSISWDEKTKIVKHTSPKMCDEARVDWVLDVESLPLNFDSLNLGCENGDLGNSNQEYIEFDIGTVSVSISSENHFDEVTSETENYTDANNTLESETEMDDECQTKQEPKPFSNSIFADFKSKESELIQTSASCLDCIDAPAPTDSCISTNDNFPPRLSNLTTVDGFDHGQSMCPTDFVPKHDSYYGIDYCRSHISDVSAVSGSEGLVTDTFPGSSTVNEEAKLINTNVKIFDPQDPPAASLQVPSFRCWTNGGILGVEPSKPPDFIHLHGRSVANLEAPVTSRESLIRNSCTVGQSIKSHDISVKQNSRASFHELPTDGTYADNHGIAQEESNATGTESILSGSGNIESQSNGCNQSVSASISHLAHRFLANNLQRRISVDHADRPISSELVNADFTKSQEISFQNDHQRRLNGFISHVSQGVDKEKTEVGSSSPPLEHMKISFHPMNGLQTSNLKLDFLCDNLHDSVGDLTFPSFQLIPGPTTSLLGSGAESDDDTFCISSYSSPDLFSLHSKSNSELWGEDERSESQKHEASDHSCRISSTTTSMCSSLEYEKTDGCSIYPAPESENLEDENCTVSFGSGPIRDLPDIDSVTFAKSQHQEICYSPSVVSIDFKPLSPNELSLPPLPPVQWRVLKPSSSLVDKSSKDAALIPSSVTLPQKEQDALRSSCNPEVLTHYVQKTHIQQNLNVRRGHNCNPKEPDEIVDLLHQIRTKSFNLRRTVIEQPRPIPGPATSANVIAILKKANLVRQAFVSNNNVGDDDSWSES